jgi:hypothetical protein
VIWQLEIRQLKNNQKFNNFSQRVVILNYHASVGDELRQFKPGAPIEWRNVHGFHQTVNSLLPDF